MLRAGIFLETFTHSFVETWRQNWKTTENTTVFTAPTRNDMQIVSPLLRFVHILHASVEIQFHNRLKRCPMKRFVITMFKDSGWNAGQKILFKVKFQFEMRLCLDFGDFSLKTIHSFEIITDTISEHLTAGVIIWKTTSTPCNTSNVQLCVNNLISCFASGLLYPFGDTPLLRLNP